MIICLVVMVIGFLLMATPEPVPSHLGRYLVVLGLIFLICNWGLRFLTWYAKQAVRKEIQKPDEQES